MRYLLTKHPQRLKTPTGMLQAELVENNFNNLQILNPELIERNEPISQALAAVFQINVKLHFRKKDLPLNTV